MGYEIDFLGKYDAESISAELKRIASVTGRPRVKSTDINQFGRVTYETVLRRFGSMRRANEAAGLMPGPVRSRSDGELLGMVAELWDRTLKEDQRRPVKADVRKYGFPVNACTITARFGTWNQALLAANEMVERRAKEQAALPPFGADGAPKSVRRFGRPFLSGRGSWYLSAINISARSAGRWAGNWNWIM